MLGHAGRSRFNGVLAAARQAFAGVQRVFGGGRQTLVERRGEDATNVPRMSGGMHAGDARSSARPLVRRARGACRCGALRHAGRVASAQPAACAGK
ncbi:hypothetical protein EGT65_09760 [Burkholderia mallei]|uniref:Uncharacterized protein n=2 Tax=Burkholderia mallei TaxID=13373 RepID=A0AAX1X360_BURML|nr:hypothetical protein EGT58_018960 [Burkholderia mallei]RPA24980.2 hypothetical protein EGT70_18210 [Burkholderia mallei]RPA42480.2 hypothetical protein EGT65_09205 [Burkholderia mallei]RPA42572.2 hypothetical protein EGT65_09760 [Burkholderia mallei]